MNNSNLAGKLPFDEDATQAIVVTGVFSPDVTLTGNFDFSTEIWKTTFGKVIHALPIPTLLLNESLRVEVANQAWSKRNCDVDEMRGCAFSDFFPNSIVKDRLERLLREVFDTRKPRVAQGKLEINEQKLWARMTFRSIRALNERLILVLIEDLTLEKRIQEQDGRHREELERESRNEPLN